MAEIVSPSILYSMMSGMQYLLNSSSGTVSLGWSQSGKYFSPVAILEPVELNGTTVKRASCSNTKWLASRGIEIGSKVKIVKRGEIIPHIEGLADE